MAEKLNPSDGEAHYLRAMGAIWSEDWALAALELDRAVALGDARSDVFQTEAFVAYKQEKRDKAIANYQKALDADPSNVLAQDYLQSLKSGKNEEENFESPAQSSWASAMTALD